MEHALAPDGTDDSGTTQEETGSGKGMTIWATLLALVLPTRSPQPEELQRDPDGPGGWRTRLARINHELAEARAGRLGDDEEEDYDTGASPPQDSAETGRS
mmetsp:Transcript_19047/g.62247  ORF Transcript_19047/g.62247 Transcript_19047/m.62247 type:complete len:101 (+) Transcript_19047:89-391(+)